MDRPRVLLLAEACNPDWPSLPVVGYKAARAIAQVADVTLVTQVRNRPAIERLGEIAGVEYIDNEYVARPMYKLAKLLRGDARVGWTTQMAMSYPSYLAFERAVWRRFRADLKSGRYDVVHRLTPMSPTLPSPLAKWSPVQFVLGPLNGGLRWPRAFDAERRREREWLSYVRGAYKLLPYWRSTYRHAAVVLAGFEHTMGEVRSLCADRLLNFPEVGYDPEVFAPPPDRPARDRVRVLFAGRLVPYKCPEVVVRAFAASPLLRRHELHIIGDGPERPRLQRLVAEHGLQGCVTLCGAQTQAQVAEAMRAADIFAFPSVRELGAGVVVEAMASGLACVVVDYGGPGGLIGPDRGVKVPLTTLDGLVTAYAAALDELVASPTETAALGRAAAQYAAENYTWHVKALSTAAVYQQARAASLDVPDWYGVQVRSTM